MAEAPLTLEEKILVFFGDEIIFTAEDVQGKFPEEHQRTIYRALNKLEETAQIRFVKWQNRKKIYTTSGVSSLPQYRDGGGNVGPLGMLLEIVPTMYDEQGHLIPLQAVDNVFIDLMWLFVIAQEDDDAELKKQFITIHSRLQEYRALLLRLADNINNVLQHPTMSGDLNKFRQTFTDRKDSAVPSAEDLLQFRRWLAQLRENSKK